MPFLLEAAVKLKEKKHWKRRWCVLETDDLEDGGCALVVSVYKLHDTSKQPLTHHLHKRITLQRFCGVYSGFVLEREQNTVALVSTLDVIILSVQDKTILNQWINSLANITKQGSCFDLFMVKTPKSFKVQSANFVKLYIMDDYLCVVYMSPVSHFAAWRLSSIEEFGLREGDRCYLIGETLGGKGGGEFVFQSVSASDLIDKMGKTRQQQLIEQARDSYMPVQPTPSGSFESCHSSALSATASKPTQLNFYEDFYLRQSRRCSLASARSSQSMASSRMASSTFTSMHSVDSSECSLEDQYSGYEEPNLPSTSHQRAPASRPVIYDVPPSRPKTCCQLSNGIYDVPPRRPTAPKPVACLGLSLYDKVPPPRRISEPARPRAMANCDYDTPPTPRPVEELRSVQEVPDVSPKTRADYNSTLRYVDLSAFDGCPDSHAKTSKPADISDSRRWSRSKSMDQTFASSHVAGDLYQNTVHQRTYSNISQPSPSPSPRPPLRPRSTEEFYSQMSKVDKTEVLRRTRKLANSSENIRAFGNQPLSVAPSTDVIHNVISESSEIADDGYVLVKQSATVPASPRSANVEMRLKNRNMPHRQHSVDSSSWRYSSDSGRMTCSNNSICSSKRRESLSSASDGSHLSLTSPGKNRPSPVPEKGRRGNRGRGLNKEYMNVSSAVRDDSESSCSDINYADLDFSVADLSTEAPTLLLREKSTSSDTEGKNSDIEYVMINIVATEAARKASEEHRKYRLNRHTVRAH